MTVAEVVIVEVGIKDVNNCCSSWNPLVLGCTRFGNEKGSFSSLKVKLARQDKVSSDEDVAVAVVGGVSGTVVVEEVVADL